jgi:hypothetical protein
VSGAAPSRRCSRSAGSSVRMPPTVGPTTATMAAADSARTPACGSTRTCAQTSGGRPLAGPAAPGWCAAATAA